MHRPQTPATPVRGSGSHNRNRRGTYVVEFALVFPVFMLFIMGLVEFGHANLVINALNNAARIGARMGTVDGVTTAQVRTKVDTIMQAALQSTSTVMVYVKDASSFDSADLDPEDVQYASLPDVELTNADAAQLFLVRVEVPYNSVALLPPFWARNLNLSGQAVMRHE
jgi:Flp pilus assembly protein TadG